MLIDLARALAGGCVWRWRESRARRALSARYPQVEFQHGSGASGECTFGPGVLVMAGTHIHDTSVGQYTYFSTQSYIQKCKIGAYCSIGPHVRIGLGSHPTRDYVSSYPAFYSPAHVVRVDFGVSTDFPESLLTTLGNDVWIGERCMIMDGVTIGDGAIIGAGAVVTRDIPSYSVAGGVPARVIRHRFDEEQIAFLKRLAWWDRDVEWIRSHAPLFSDIKLLVGALEEEAATR
jgi:acetyltransferase-like isoleucine patch superfamily enzyme